MAPNSLGITQDNKIVVSCSMLNPKTLNPVVVSMFLSIIPIYYPHITPILYPFSKEDEECAASLGPRKHFRELLTLGV